MVRWVTLGCVLVVLAACAGSPADPSEAGSSTTPVSTEVPAVPAVTSPPVATSMAPSTTMAAPDTTVTTPEAPIAGSTTPTSTTTTVVEPEFVVIAPGDGLYTDNQPVGGVYGDVSSEAVVTVGGVHADVSYVGDTVFGDRMWRWHLWDDITLQQGTNDVVFEATFADGSTLRETRRYHYDPSLRSSTGYILELTLAIPPRVTVEYATLEYGELGLEQTSDDTETAEIPITDDAVFVVLGGPNIAADQVLDLEGFTQLAATATGEEPHPDLWWDTIFPTTPTGSWLKAAPWEFLITPDGRLQQAAQLYSP